MSQNPHEPYDTSTTGSHFSPASAGPAVNVAERPKKRRGATVALVIVLVLLLCGIAAGSWYILSVLNAEQEAAQEMEQREKPETPEEPDATPTGTDEASDSVAEEDPETDEEPTVELVDNPIDFASLQTENSDIYAWLYIPGAEINLPVLQNAYDDFYYLTHDYHGNYEICGSVFSQMANAKDFSDPVTVLYGHNADGYFYNLHYFADEQFFYENTLMYLYTPGHILTYKIVAAYQYDDRHILNSFDFTNPTVLQQYYDYILNPDSLQANVREGIELTADDKIVQLSTCMLNGLQTNSRFIVTGVLIDDQATW